MVKKISIAGAGCGGLILAKELALAGMDVTVYEALSKDQLLSQYNWSDAVELCILKDVGLPIPFAAGDRWHGAGVMGEDESFPLYQPRRVSEMGIYSPDFSTRTATDVDFRFVLADRAVLLKWLLENAEQAGATILYSCNIKGLLGQNIATGSLGEIKIEGLSVERNGQQKDQYCDLVVDATGQSSALRSMLKGAPQISSPFMANQYSYVFKTHRKCSDTEVVAQHADAQHPPIRHYRRMRTKEGYVWFHPHDKHQFDIGGGAPTMEQAIQNINEIIQYIPGATEEEFGGAKCKNVKGLPPDALVASGFMVIGHAAAQLHPAHGCGISTAFMAALLAAQILKKATVFDIQTLWEYAYRWISTKGAHIVALFFRLKELEEDETTFLIEHNIINGETLTNDYNSNYLPPDVNEVRRIEDLYPVNPALLSRWMSAEEKSAQSFAHCKRYPSHWSRSAFESWCNSKPY